MQIEAHFRIVSPHAAEVVRGLLVSHVLKILQKTGQAHTRGDLSSVLFLNVIMLPHPTPPPHPKERGSGRKFLPIKVIILPHPNPPPPPHTHIHTHSTYTHSTSSDGWSRHTASSDVLFRSTLGFDPQRRWESNRIVAETEVAFHLLRRILLFYPVGFKVNRFHY